MRAHAHGHSASARSSAWVSVSGCARIGGCILRRFVEWWRVSGISLRRRSPSWSGQLTDLGKYIRPYNYRLMSALRWSSDGRWCSAATWQHCLIDDAQIMILIRLAAAAEASRCHSWHCSCSACSSDLCSRFPLNHCQAIYTEVCLYISLSVPLHMSICLTPGVFVSTMTVLSVSGALLAMRKH